MKRLFNNTVFTSLDSFIVVALNLLFTPVLIRNFGVEGYGAFVFLSIFSIYGVFNFFDLGMEGSLVMYVARFEAAGDHRKMQDTLSISLVYYAVMGLVLGLILYLSAGFIAGRFIDDTATLDRTGVLTAIAYISCNLFLQFVTLPLTAILEGMRRFVVTKSVNSVMNILRYLLVTAVAVIFHRIDLAFLVLLGLSVIRLLVLLFIYVFKLPYFRAMQVRFDFSLLRKLFNYSSLLFIYKIIGLIHNQIDKGLIWLYLAVSNLAVYDVVSRPANLLSLVISVITAAVVPEVARLHQLGDIAAIRKVFINLVRYAYLVVLPVLAVFYSYIGDLLHLWVGPEFVPYAYLAMIALATYLIAPIPAIGLNVVIGLERVKQTIWIPIVSTVINATLSIALVHVYGVAGLLLATFTAALFALFPYLYMLRGFLEMRLSELAFPVLRAGGAALLFFLAHKTVYLLTDASLAAVVPAAILLFGLNCFLNYRFFLSDSERVFLWERVRFLRNRITGVASNG